MSHQRRFQILRKIAHGGFGTVFLVRLQQYDGFSRVVAVKLLHAQWSENAEVAGRMRDEARLLGLLSHRNIVNVMDLTRLDGRVAIVMEYVEAIDLDTLIRDQADRSSSIPVPAALEIIAQAASALDAAYNRVPPEADRPLRAVHRDIKPSNIMLDADGGVKLLDFGLARADFDEREAETRGMAFGSYDYMPSERRFQESGGETSDVYSLGAVLYELICMKPIGTGRLKPEQHAVWVQERVAEVQHVLGSSGQATDELLDMLRAMLAFDADDRPVPRDVVARLRALERALDGVSLQAWAVDLVPGLVQASRQEQDRAEPSPLVGQTLVEDRLLRGDPTPAPPTPPWESDPSTPIPKRIRDAAPARPPISGTVTPAPLRPRADSNGPSNGSQHELGSPYTPPSVPGRDDQDRASSSPGPTPSRQPPSPSPSPLPSPSPPPRPSPALRAFAGLIYGALWALGVLLLVVGAGALLGVVLLRFFG